LGSARRDGPILNQIFWGPEIPPFKFSAMKYRDKYARRF
jgi:hypothetical protein